LDPSTVLTYWIGDAAKDPTAARARAKLWYRSSAKADAALTTQFGEILHLAEQQALPHWQTSIEGQLALIILLDQFSRNIYRGTAHAFANDGQALAIASQLISANQHLSLTPIEQVFVYHPFEHAEDLATQQQSVQLFQCLLNNAPTTWHHQLRGFLHHAQEHHDIVATYGRFPHRNRVLGRTHSAAENDYLVNARRFGQ